MLKAIDFRSKEDMQNQSRWSNLGYLQHLAVIRASNAPMRFVWRLAGGRRAKQHRA